MNRKKAMSYAARSYKHFKSNAKIINDLMRRCDRTYNGSGDCEARCDKVWDYYNHPRNPIWRERPVECLDPQGDVERLFAGDSVNSVSWVYLLLLPSREQ